MQALFRRRVFLGASFVKTAVRLAPSLPSLVHRGRAVETPETNCIKLKFASPSPTSLTWTQSQPSEATNRDNGRRDKSRGTGALSYLNRLDSTSGSLCRSTHTLGGSTLELSTFDFRLLCARENFKYFWLELAGEGE